MNTMNSFETRFMNYLTYELEKGIPYSVAIQNCAKYHDVSADYIEQIASNKAPQLKAKYTTGK